jgi:hypothetical protein
VGLAGAFGGLEGFAITVGIVGTVGTVVAALDARRSGERVRAVAEEVRFMVDDLVATSQAERRLRLHQAIGRVLVAASRAQYPRGDEGIQPLDWERLSRLSSDLQTALAGAGRMDFPRSKNLLSILDAMPQVTRLEQLIGWQASADQLAELVTAADDATRGISVRMEASEYEEYLLNVAAADDEPLTDEDRAVIREGLAEYAQGRVTARLDRGIGVYAIRARRDLGPRYQWAHEHAARLPLGDLRGLPGIDPPTWRLRRVEWRLLFVRPEAGMLLVVRVTHRSQGVVSQSPPDR